MTFALFIEQVINGLITGSIYALFAVGLALVLGVMDVVNTAHGEMFMLGAYSALAVISTIGAGPWLYLVVAALTGFAAGIVIDAVALRPLRRRSGVDMHMASIILTFGISMIVQNGALRLFGAKYHKMPELIAGATLIWGMVFINQHLLTLALALTAMGMLFVFLEYSRLGQAIRATAQNPNAARLVGIDTDRVSMLTFGIGAALAAVAGALIAPLYFVQPTMGSGIILKAFAIVIVGGLGSIPGAVVGAFLLGIAKSVGASFLSYGYKDAIGFMMLAVALLLRPLGLFGTAVRY